MTDNFKLFEDYVYVSTPNRGRTINDDPDKYWVVEIIGRGKDREGPGQNVHFKNYYITTISELYRYEHEIKTLCDVFKFRAYISVNYKSYKQVTLNACATYADRIAKHEYKKPYNIFENCSGKYVDHSDRKWIIDLDLGDEFEEFPKGYVDGLINIMHDCKPEGTKLFMKFPTKNGLHLIVSPFDRIQFMEKYKKFCDENLYIYNENFLRDHIKENHLTLLYENLD